MSGWSLRVNDDQREFGECDTRDDAAVFQIVQWAVRTAVRSTMPLVLVLEHHPWAGTPMTLAGLGAARERWLVAWRAAGQPMGRHVKVTPAEWRACVLGPTWVRAKREAVRAEEKRIAEAMVEQPVGVDEAPALLIGRWAARAAKVGAALGMRTEGLEARA